MSNFQEQGYNHHSSTNGSSTPNGASKLPGAADVWVIDNDIAFRFLLRCELEDSPIRGRIRMFDDGDLALLKLITICSLNKALLPKAIFTNIDSNRVGGWELVRTLNEFELDVDVVLFSADPTNLDYEKMLDKPQVKDVIIKQHDPANIVEKIKQFTSAHQT